MIDCHAHVFDPLRFPPRAAAPLAGHEPQDVDAYRATLAAFGFSGGVLVQPTSGYDDDHACLLAALDAAQGSLRGVARFSPRCPAAVVELLDHPRIDGVRLDLVNDGADVAGHPDLPHLLAALRERGAVLDVQCAGDQLAAALPMLLRSGVTLVVDHCGRPDPAAGLHQPGFRTLLELAREGHFVKLSGPFRFSREPWPHRDAQAFIAPLLDAFTPARCVWGSDWPFVRLAHRPAFGDAFAWFSPWLRDPQVARDVMDLAPRRLFRFGAAA